MSPRRAAQPPSPTVHAVGGRVGVLLGETIRSARTRRRWTLRALADRAGVSASAVHDAERGQASLEMYARLGHALGLRLEAELVDHRRRADPRGEVDLVHSAMAELEASHLRAFGFLIAIDEPYQHFQFAGRADLLAWTVEHRALLHVENRTRFPDLQKAAGSYNAKRSYLPGVFAQRIGLRGGFVSVTHVVAALWSAEVIHTIRLRAATFRSLCPDPPTALEAWWSGQPPARGATSTFVLLDPTASGRQLVWLDLEGAISRAHPRFRDYADAASRLRGR